MKKKLSVATSAILLTAMTLSMVGCGENTEKLVPTYEGSYSAKLEMIGSFSSSPNSRYSFSGLSDSGIVVIQETYDSSYTSYKLFNLNTMQDCNVSSPLPLHRLSENLYYTVESTSSTPRYTLYTPSGIYNNLTYVEGSISSGVFTEKSTGYRTYVNVKGDIITETNHFTPILTYDDSYDKVDNYYVSNDLMFNKDGEFEKPFNVTLAANVSKDASSTGKVILDDRIIYQYTTSLPDSAEEYTYIVNKTKMLLQTFSYSPKEDKVREIKDFEYLVESVVQVNDENVILNVRKITDKTLSAQTIIQCFDKKGNVAVDIQSLVNGATSYSWDDKYVYIKDYAGFTYVYEERKLIQTINKNLTFIDSTAYYRDSSTNTLHLYDFDNEDYYRQIYNVTACGKTDTGDLWYRVSSTDMYGETLYVYDVDSNSDTTIRTINSSSQSMSVTSSYVVISSSDYSNQKEIVFFDNNLQILNCYSYTTNSLSTDDKTFTIITTSNMDGYKTYYLWTQTKSHLAK